MKSIKIIKFIAIGLGVIGPAGFGLNLVSCGQSNNNSYTWGQFKPAATHERAFNIVKSTKPVGWDSVMASSLSVVNIQTNEKTKEITLDIELTKNNAEGVDRASFSIDYLDGAKYDVADWICRQQPHTVVSSWATYRNLALNVKPEDLKKAIHPWTDKNKFKWAYGTIADSTWNQDNIPIFDTYGSLNNNSIYKGMHGKPVVNEFYKTITVIICRGVPVDPKSQLDTGNFNSCPIKAVMSYKENPIYNINTWVTTPVAQLQSLDMWTYYWNKSFLESTDQDGIYVFIKNWCWMTLSAHGNGINVEDTWSSPSHPDNWGISAMLTHYGFPNISYFGVVSYSVPGQEGNNKYVARISVRFICQTLYSGSYKCILNLYSFFYFANGADPTGGGSAWNYVFKADVIFVKE